MSAVTLDIARPIPHPGELSETGFSFNVSKISAAPGQAGAVAKKAGFLERTR
jgi:hypothetical protein